MADLSTVRIAGATMTQKTETVVSIFAAVLLVVVAFIDLRIAATIATVFLIAFTVIRMMLKRRRVDETSKSFRGG
jgi:hypothetical protein